MSGLVYRDLLLFFRKNSKITYIMEFVYFLFFLLALRNIYGAATYLTLVVPINMCGLPTILKEMDTNYKGMMSVRLLPYRKVDIVRGRFASAFTIYIYYLAVMVIFSICHYFICGDISWKLYAVSIATGLLVAIFITALNLLASFLSSFNVMAIIYFIIILSIIGLYLLFMLTDLHNIILSLLAKTGPEIMWGVAILVDMIALLISYILSVRKFQRS